MKIQNLTSLAALPASGSIALMPLHSLTELLLGNAITFVALNMDKRNSINRAAGLIIATIISSAVVGGSIGWFYPWLNFTATQVTKTVK